MADDDVKNVMDILEVDEERARALIAEHGSGAAAIAAGNPDDDDAVPSECQDDCLSPCVAATAGLQASLLPLAPRVWWEA
jgi:hypothetical protein